MVTCSDIFECVCNVCVMCVFTDMDMHACVHLKLSVLCLCTVTLMCAYTTHPHIITEHTHHHTSSLNTHTVTHHHRTHAPSHIITEHTHPRIITEHTCTGTHTQEHKHCHISSLNAHTHIYTHIHTHTYTHTHTGAHKYSMVQRKMKAHASIPTLNASRDLHSIGWLRCLQDLGM